MGSIEMVHNGEGAEFSYFPIATGKGSTKPAPPAVLCSKELNSLCRNFEDVWFSLQLCLANEGVNFFVRRGRANAA